MTLFLNLRAAPVAGGVVDPAFFEGDGAAAPLALHPRATARIAAQLNGRDVLFATHGFNVPMAAGACALTRFEAALALPSSCCFVGLLWPGDFWVPVINYPFEGEVALDCGRRIARFCNTALGAMSSVTFVSHSLGARVVLEATRNIERRVRAMCLLAAAVNDDALVTQYADAFANTSLVSVLASRHDHVLAQAYPVGDAIADLLHFDHRPYTLALGFNGPPAPVGATIPPWLIGGEIAYDHGDYLPPSDPTVPLPISGKWVEVAAFTRRCWSNTPQTWPV